MQKWWWVLPVVAALLSAAILMVIALDRFARGRPQNLDGLPRRDSVIHGKTLTLLVADSSGAVGSGLSGQQGLPERAGLLLVSPDGDTRVTMLGMTFPLDILWVDEVGRVVGIRRDVPARPWPLSYSSPRPSSAVIELAAGAVNQYGIVVGDVIKGAAH
ncbi:MAG: DUF192 domain-containing protein [Propionibacteriaceae bacterium]